MMLSSDELCAIIQKCSGASVTSLKISKDGIEILFSEPKIHITGETVPESVPQATLNQEPTEFEQLEVTERDPKEIDAEDELAELNLSDPLAYETRLASGELVDGERNQEES